jgi:Uncharacterized protein conserved in bacteria (DUF2059)
MRKRCALVALMIGMTAMGCSRAPQPKSQKTELARELITVAKLDRGIGNLLKRARTDTNFKLPQEFSVSNLEKIEQAYVDAYASVYSSKELQAFIEFFKSPEGQQWVEKQKQVNAKVASTIERLMPQTFESTRKYINGLGASSISSNSLSSSNSLPNPAPSTSP